MQSLTATSTSQFYSIMLNNDKVDQAVKKGLNHNQKHLG